MARTGIPAANIGTVTGCPQPVSSHGGCGRTREERGTQGLGRGGRSRHGVMLEDAAVAKEMPLHLGEIAWSLLGLPWARSQRPTESDKSPCSLTWAQHGTGELGLGRKLASCSLDCGSLGDCIAEFGRTNSTAQWGPARVTGGRASCLTTNQSVCWFIPRRLLCCCPSDLPPTWMCRGHLPFG